MKEALNIETERVDDLPLLVSQIPRDAQRAKLKQRSRKQTAPEATL